MRSINSTKLANCLAEYWTLDGLRVICAGLGDDLEIGIHILKMLAKFRDEGIV